METAGRFEFFAIIGKMPNYFLLGELEKSKERQSF